MTHAERARRITPDKARGADGIVVYGPTGYAKTPRRRGIVSTTDVLAKGVTSVTNGGGKGGRKDVRCPTCGVVFRRAKARQVCCSQECAQRRWRG